MNYDVTLALIQIPQEHSRMPHTILLVDDDEGLRALVGIMLKRAGYNVQQAESGDDAVAMLESGLPDLFIVDVMMPGMNGFELCRHLRATPETAQHPILLLSAKTDNDSMMEGLSSGANLYLHKPIESAELIARIEQFLNVGESNDPAQ
jgi:DNA-binding response OmpR family regulator